MMNKLGIYVHIPFCVRKCLYCDFLSFSSCPNEKEDYIRALIKESEIMHERFNEYSVSSVFFGGGTPTVLDPKTLCNILDELRNNYYFADDCEISIECNPKTACLEDFKTLRRAGFNRLSIGVQSFDDKVLKRLGRIHTSSEAKKTIDEAFAAGFKNVNLDLMSAVPGQDVKLWENDLRTAASFNVQHISAYSLILEEGTYLDSHKDEYDFPDENEERLMYEMTAGILSEYGYNQYEISNYALSGYECRHNTGYWTHVPYLGLGLGSSSFYNSQRIENTRDINKYIETVSSGSPAGKTVETLDKIGLMTEYIILGLRMIKGISIDEFKKNFDIDIHELYGDIIKKYSEGGFLVEEDGRLKFSRKGISVSNSILADFI